MTDENEVDPRLIELAARQQLLNQGTQQFARALAEATGKPPVAILVICHWPEDVMFGHVMSSAPPQAQMNAVDAMLKHLNVIGQKLKQAINTVRHGGPLDPSERH